MRRTFDTCLYKDNKNIKFVAKMLGHTKINTINRYVHIKDCIIRQLNNNMFNISYGLRKFVRLKQDKIRLLSNLQREDIAWKRKSFYSLIF